MTEQPESSLADVIVNRIIMVVIGLMILLFGVPMAISGVDSVFAGLGGEAFSIWSIGVILIAAVMIVLGVGMLWLAVKPPYRASK